MTAEAKRLTLECWMTALDAFKVRLRKCLRIVLASGIPTSIIRQSVIDVLDDIEKQER